MKRLVLSLFLLAFAFTNGHAQTGDSADALFQAGEWAAASAAYAALATATPDDGRLWYRLGYTHHQQGQFADAATAWAKADALGFAPVFTKYNLAAAHARLGHADDAFAWLDKATAAGLNQPGLLDTDDDFASLRADDRFAALRTAVDRNANPCRYSEKARQFDFWVGSWAVANPQGAQAGVNRVVLIQGDCVLQENWSGTGGSTGTSFNYYDPEIDAWKQLWVDAGGNHADFTGHFRDGAMHFEGQWTAPNGTPSLMKMIFTPLEDGRVRQYIEQSTDGGATYAPWFDGYYARSEEGM